MKDNPKDGGPQTDLEKELADALLDMVAQHCYDSNEKGRLFSGALHANADAMRLLGRIGLLEIDDRGMRIVFGKFVEPSKEAEGK